MTLYDMIFPRMCPYCGELMGELRESCEKCEPLLFGEPMSRTLPCGAECVSAFEYIGEYRNALLTYKFKAHRQFCKPFSYTLIRLMTDEIGRENIDCITGVPTQRKRRGRAFDQVRCLAEQTAKNSDIPYEKLLFQKRQKKPQHTLTMQARMENVRDLYGVRPNANIEGRRIVLIDDIVTTGATLDSCARALQDAKAASVLCVTLACTC